MAPRSTSLQVLPVTTVQSGVKRMPRSPVQGAGTGVGVGLQTVFAVAWSGEVFELVSVIEAGMSYSPISASAGKSIELSATIAAPATPGAKQATSSAAAPAASSATRPKRVAAPRAMDGV